MGIEEQDPWGADDGQVASGPTPAPLPVVTTSMASLVNGVVPYQKGRLVGDFEITALPDSALNVYLREVTFCGKRHTGAVGFSDKGTVLVRSHVRANICDSSTLAADRAIEEAAKDVARQWIARHPDAFEAADAIAARRAFEAATSQVRKLRDELAKAETAEKDARRNADWREAALANRGIVFTDGEGAPHSP